MTKKELSEFSSDGASENASFLFASDDIEKQIKFANAMKEILPRLPIHSDKVILAQVLIALMIEGIVQDPGDKEKKIVTTIKNAILKDPVKRQQAFKFAQNAIQSPKKMDQISP